MGADLLEQGARAVPAHLGPTCFMAHGLDRGGKEWQVTTRPLPTVAAEKLADGGSVMIG